MPESVKISNIEFTASEWDAIVKIASKKRGYSLELTPPNVLRLALGITTKKRGGARPNTGNRVKASALHPSGDAETGRRAGERQKKP